MRVVVAGGGTAGHVNPALALAEALRPDETIFIGTARGAEAHLVPDAGFTLEQVRVQGFDRSRPWSLPATAAVALGAVRAAHRVIRRLEPCAVVGMGGYVSLPACVAARMAGTPVVLHEQNIVLGLANRVSKPLAKRVAVSFPETAEALGDKAVLTGNPVLAELATLDVESARPAGYERFALDPARRTLLVFGGSQGARTLNAAGAGLVPLWRDRRDLQVLHITGRGSFDAVRAATDAAASGDLLYRAVPYVEKMGEAYAVADLALCRGGATTVAELQAVGLPAIVVPYPFHRDRQQELHGRSLEKRGAAVVVRDAAASPEEVARIAGALLADADRLARMGAAAGSDEVRDAADALAAVVREVAS